MQRNAVTRYPILLVHGLFGFERIGHFELFHDVKEALKTAENRVFVPHLSATHNNEMRGEQLLAQIDRVLRGIWRVRHTRSTRAAVQRSHQRRPTAGRGR